MNTLKRRNGFTLIELILVVSLLSAVLVVTTITLFRPLSKANLDAVASDIAATLREAQDKSMNTDTAGGPQTSEYGLHFETASYTLFRGTSFSQSSPDNFKVNTPSSISLEADLPCPSPPTECNNVVFAKISGGVSGFDNTKNSVCIRETNSNNEQLLRINFLGVVNIQDGC
ncbi:MAG: type II secretion system protein [Candidatus Woykebacteria bacterium]